MLWIQLSKEIVPGKKSEFWRANGWPICTWMLNKDHTLCSKDSYFHFRKILTKHSGKSILKTDLPTHKRMILLVILISDLIPSYGHTCSFVDHRSGRQTHSFRLHCRRDSTGDTGRSLLWTHWFLLPSVKFPKSTFIKKSIFEKIVFFEWQKSHFTPLMSQEKCCR